MIAKRALAALLAVVAFGAVGPAVRAQDRSAVCKHVDHADAGYIVCTVDLRRFDLKLFWKAPDGEPYGSFDRLLQARAGQPNLAFAMNAGMYHKDLSPVGLYVENARQLKRANTANGPGNFHLKPNGVFFVEGQKAGILETEAFLRTRPRAEFATQSGPMLVIDGRLHPKISEDGISRKRRNGVGVRDPNTAVFAISDGAVTFGAFAHLFRDGLGCANALFLDGSISSVYAPDLERTDSLFPMGPIVAAVKRPATGAAPAR